MSSEGAEAWTVRVAPAPLRLVQDFLNAPRDEPGADELRVAELVRREAASGEQQASLAARYGRSQTWVSAVLRGARAVAITTGDGGIAAAPGLGSAASLRGWLEANGFALRAITEREHARVMELHGSLLALCLGNNGEPVLAEARATLDRVAADVPLLVRFDNDARPRLVGSADGVSAFMADILAAVYDAMRDGTWPRLKACPAERCQHVFYDASRNRTSTWCSMAICGNRTKVRGYQERLRAARTQ